MAHNNTVFAQVLKLVPRHQFEKLVRKHKSGRMSRSMTRWNQFVAMGMAQLTGRCSAAVFAFLWDPSVDATNWRAEHAIRPAVVTRKVCGGNRTRRGADTQQVLASVVRTAHQRNLDLAPLIATMLRATNPTAPDQLQRPPPPLTS